MTMVSKRKTDMKLVVGFVVGILALIGGVVATFLIPAKQSVVEEAVMNEVSQATCNEETKATKIYDNTDLKNKIDNIYKVYDRFDKHVEATYGASATTIDLANDLEAQTMLDDFMMAVDELDQAISASPYTDLKETWKTFQESFNKRRAFIKNGMNQEEDYEWALNLVSVYLVASNKYEVVE
jgi:hypothetical protein